MSSGYSISIKALDQASAEIKRINQALKDLERADSSASTASQERLRQQKGVFDQLNQGTAQWAKASKSVLQDLGKHYTQASGAIGQLSSQLEKNGAIGAKLLGGLALGLGALALGAEKFRREMNEAADAARRLGNQAYRSGVNPQELQKAQIAHRLLGISAEAATESLQGLNEAQREAWAHGGGDLGALYARWNKDFNAGLDLRGNPAENLEKLEKIMARLYKTGRPDDAAKAREVQRAAHLSPEILDAIQNAQKLDEAYQKADTSFTKYSNDYLAAFSRLKYANDELSQRWESLGRSFANIFGPGAANMVASLTEKINALLESVNKFLDRFSSFHDFAEWLDSKITGKPPKEFTAPIPPAKPGEAGYIAPGAAGAGNATGAGGVGGGKGSLTQAAYEAISRAEGTYGKGGIDYNMLPGGGHADLVNMSIAQAIEASRNAGDGVGGFQELHSTIGNAASGLGMDINKEKFSPENQRKIADWIYQKQGAGAWHGFNQHPEELQKFNGAMAGTGGGKGSLADAMENLNIVGKTFHNDCARIVNVAARLAGLPPITDANGNVSNIATNAARWGQGVAGNDIKRGDMAVHMNGRGIGQTGGHVATVEKVYYDSQGNPVAIDELGTNRTTSGEGYEGKGGIRHRNIQGDDMFRRASPVMSTKNKAAGVDKQAADSHHSVEIAFNNLPQGARVNLHESRGSSALNVKTSYAMGTV